MNTLEYKRSFNEYLSASDPKEPLKKRAKIDPFSTSYQIAAIPRELLLEIFNFTVANSLRRNLSILSLVCLDWRRVSMQLYLNSINAYIPLSKIFQFNSASTFDVQRLLKLEAGGQKLHSLNFDSCNLFSDADFSSLTCLKHLKRLNISNSETDEEETVRVCARLPTLRKLRIYFDTVDRAEAEIFTQLTQLHTLTLNFTELTNSGLGIIAKLSNLHSLNLSGHEEWQPNRTADHNLEAIALLTQLKHLKLRDCSDMTDAGIQAIWKLTKLQSLHFGPGTGIFDISAIRQLTNLRSLSFSSSHECTERCLKSIAQLTQLERLILPSITCEGLKALTALPRLINLNHAPYPIPQGLQA